MTTIRRRRDAAVRMRRRREGAKQAVAHECECDRDCGQLTNVKQVKGKGWVPFRFVAGHNVRVGVAPDSFLRHATALERKSPTASGRRLQYLMKIRKIKSISELAKQTGISPGTVNDIVSGRYETAYTAAARKLAAWDGEWTAERYAGSRVTKRVGTMRPPVIIAAMRWHLAQHPEDELASRLVDDLLNRTRGRTTILATFGRDPDYARLRGVIPRWAIRSRGKQNSSEGRFLRSFQETYRIAAKGQVPTWASLVEPDRTGGRRPNQKLPVELTSRWGAVVFCAVVQQLRLAGLTQIAIAKRFGFTIQYGAHGPHSRMASVLLNVAETMSRKALPEGTRSTHWRRAKNEASAYLRKVVPEERSGSFSLDGG